MHRTCTNISKDKLMKPLYRLVNAKFIYDSSDSERASGNVHGHPLFPDGSEITTSEIVGFEPGHNIIITKNSRYEIENWSRRKDEGFSEEEIQQMFSELQRSGDWQGY